MGDCKVNQWSLSEQSSIHGIAISTSHRSTQNVSFMLTLVGLHFAVCNVTLTVSNPESFTDKIYTQPTTLHCSQLKIMQAISKSPISCTLPHKLKRSGIPPSTAFYPWRLFCCHYVCLNSHNFYNSGSDAAVCG